MNIDVRKLPQSMTSEFARNRNVNYYIRVNPHSSANLQGATTRAAVEEVAPQQITT